MKLEKKIISWAKDKDILDNSNTLKQHVKTQEEVNELLEALINRNPLDVEDAIGDIAVTLIIQAELNEMSFEKCIQTAYNIIKHREGKMINGYFIKNK